MVFPDMVDPPKSMLIPSRWHITVMRGYWPEGVDAAEAATRLEHRASMLWNALIPPSTLTLTHPPWQRSWTFGVEVKWEQFVLAFRAALDYIASSMNICVQQHREIHISWH